LQKDIIVSFQNTLGFAQNSSVFCWNSHDFY